MEEIIDIKQVQKISLDILIFIDKLCRENNIRYSIEGGTLIGAVRHKGFIPWDDDIDLLMPRPDYDKFLNLMEKIDNKRYKALYDYDKHGGFFGRFAKVVDLDTHIIEGDYKENPYLGVFVDIFPMDGVDKNKAKKKFKKARRINDFICFSSLTSCEKITQNNHPLKKVLKKSAIKFIKLFGTRFWIKKFDSFVAKHKYEDYDFIFPYSSTYGVKTMIPKTYFDELVELEFEGYKFMSIKNYKEYLKNVYGDYMKLPPLEKQTSHHDFKIYKK